MNQILNQQAIIKRNFTEMEENLFRLKTFLGESSHLKSRWAERVARLNKLEANKWATNGGVLDSEKVNAMLSLKSVAEKQFNHYEKVLFDGNAILETMEKRYAELKKVFEKFSVYNSLNSLESMAQNTQNKPSINNEKLAELTQESRYIAHTTEAFMELEIGKTVTDGEATNE